MKSSRREPLNNAPRFSPLVTYNGLLILWVLVAGLRWVLLQHYCSMMWTKLPLVPVLAMPSLQVAAREDVPVAVAKEILEEGASLSNLS